MATQSERKEKIEQIRRFPVELETLLARYPESRLDIPVQSGGWIIRLDKYAGHCQDHLDQIRQLAA